jgi:hypothetical protein
MFKLIKWVLLLTIWAKSKVKLVAILLIWISLIIFSQVINDILEFTDNNDLYLIYIKWAVILVLSVFSGYLIFKVYLDLYPSSKPEASGSVTKGAEQNARKRRILAKEKVKTKSESIIEKYEGN